MDKWQEIFGLLLNEGLEVYAPGGHVGICTAPYCVVQSGAGSIPKGTKLLGRCEYRIYLVVPADEPGKLGWLENRVRKALAPLLACGVLELAAPRSPMLPDDGFSALVSYIDYICCYSERN